MTNWVRDITAAPRGRMVPKRIRTKDGFKQGEEFEADIILAATKCGQVIRSYWLPESGSTPGRWSGFATGEAPVAWQHWPKHPDAA